MSPGLLQQGLRPVWVGVPAGLVLSVVTTRLMPSILPSGERNDPRLFAIGVPVLLVVIVLSAFVPARRAARVDPTVALRYE